MAALGLATVLLTSGAAPAPEINSPQGLFQWRPFLAPFHAVVLHFPIGFITLAFILEFFYLRRPSAELQRITRMVTWLSLAAAVVSATFGILRAETGGYEAHALNLHRIFGLWVPALILATLAAQAVAYRRTGKRAGVFIYRALLSATFVTIVIAGHLGGNLTHGSHYLVENAPKFVRELLRDHPSQAANLKADSSEEDRYFAEKVQPIFARKCLDCHGPQKQKGGYRLDQREIALRGGESGKTAIKPGDPIQSHLVGLILLPPQHDDAMPPDGKEPLTLEEIAIVLDWVRKGAFFPTNTASISVHNSKRE